MATNCILQDLYAQILQSEEQVKERNAKFKAVNEEIALTQAKTAEIRDELKSLQGNLAIQNNKVAEQELQLKWLKEKEKIMNSQKKHLEDTKMESQNTEKFVGECEEFSSMFDLTGDGTSKRETAKRAKLEELIKNTEKLKSEADRTIQGEKDETERLRQEKQKLSEKLRNDPELQR
ncbi:Hypothetical predicted protein [Paramuricea clavata]|uniref:Coiled-coil domain-containing protein 172 n=1 Tax=Paramuricea clavata TaxID=317549 RepID=A0A7D9HEE5_PARCT|nr:Hypothetical predicted protein [Paramuricea clavata]